jgi:predicted TPR repeat methyltransferase
MAHSHIKNKEPVLRYLADYVATNGAEPTRILDLGIGAGDFGPLIKERFQRAIRLTGVEVWQKNRDPNWDAYDEIFVEDMRSYLRRANGTFDFVMLIDVLEHLPKSEGRQLLDRVKHLARHGVIVSTPITAYPQLAVWGNPHQRHKCVWTDEDMKGEGFEQVFEARIFTWCIWKPLSSLGVYVCRLDGQM